MDLVDLVVRVPDIRLKLTNDKSEMAALKSAIDIVHLVLGLINTFAAISDCVVWKGR